MLRIYTSPRITLVCSGLTQNLICAVLVTVKTVVGRNATVASISPSTIFICIKYRHDKYMFQQARAYQYRLQYRHVVA